MDWNWFFSSLAQSAAAIVGIFGAFIITKILSNQTIFNEKNGRIRDLLIIANKIKYDAGELCIEWYNKHRNRIHFYKVDDYINENKLYDAESIYCIMNFSIFEKNEIVIDKIRFHLKERARDENRLISDTSILSMISDSPYMKHFNFQRTHLLSADLYLNQQLSQERDKIDRVVAEAKNHTRVILDFIESIKNNPESSLIVTYSLIFIILLFYIGVIYPLSLLPMPQKWELNFSLNSILSYLFSLRGSLLFLVSSLFTLLIGMFFMMNIKLKYSKKTINNLINFASLSAYSEYFAIMEDNLKFKEIVQRKLSQSRCTNS